MSHKQSLRTFARVALFKDSRKTPTTTLNHLRFLTIAAQVRQHIRHVMLLEVAKSHPVALGHARTRKIKRHHRAWGRSKNLFWGGRADFFNNRSGKCVKTTLLWTFPSCAFSSFPSVLEPFFIRLGTYVHVVNIDHC